MRDWPRGRLYPRSMIDPHTWRDEVKFHAMTVAMAAFMTPGRTQADYQARALSRLIEAVEAETWRRGRCRDTSVAASVRLPGW